MTEPIIEPKEWGCWSSLERQLASAITGLSGSNDPVHWLLLALTLHAVKEGHVCLRLDRVASVRVDALIPDAEAKVPQAQLTLVMPELQRIKESLAAWVAVGTPAEGCPLVMDGERLYLARYYTSERRLAARLVERLRPLQCPVPSELLESIVADPQVGGNTESLRSLLRMALGGRLSIITGGPGTGKTTVVKRLMAALFELAERTGTRPPRIELLAPTGKAAVRLSESVARQSQPHFNPPTRARTIHRALAEVGASDGRMSAELVVVDEASMVDVSLFGRLMDAVTDVERVVLLGDPHQLTSVEAGSVLLDLVALGDLSVPGVRSVSEALSRRMVELVYSYRFESDGGIGRLSRAIRAGDTRQVESLLLAARRSIYQPDDAGSGDEPLRFIECEEGELSLVKPWLEDGFEELVNATGPEEALRTAGRFRVLAAHRQGPSGVEGLNRKIAAWLWSRWVPVKKDRSRWGNARPELIMVSVNAPHVGLSNGDGGILWCEPSGESRAYFLGDAGKARSLSPVRLPPIAPAFAMSIHKSQGSEAEHVFIVLPKAGSPLLTRELLYTAVTRAQRRCTVVGTLAAVRWAMDRHAERHSGLVEALRLAFEEEQRGAPCQEGGPA